MLEKCRNAVGTLVLAILAILMLSVAAWFEKPHVVNATLRWVLTIVGLSQPTPSKGVFDG